MFFALIQQFLNVLLAMYLISKACDGFEAATGYLGRNFTDGVRGATFNAIGSSIPELLATLIALVLYHDKAGFAFGIGTTAGSAVFNSVVIPASVILFVVYAGVATSINVSKKVILRDGIILLLCELLLILVLQNNELTFYHGLALVGAYVAYALYMLKGQKGNEENEEYEDEISQPDMSSRFVRLLKGDFRYALLESKELNTKRAWALLGVTTAVVAIACHWLVVSCYAIGSILEVNTYFVAVLLAAAATSVPDTIISLKDAKNGEYDDAIANALGSNIFDICFCLGFPLMLFCIFTGETISMEGSDMKNVAVLRVLLFLVTGLVFGILYFSKELTKRHGYYLLGIYAAFVAFIFGSVYEVGFVLDLSKGLASVLTMGH